MPAEINAFFTGGHIKVLFSDLEGADGNPYPWPNAELVKQLKELTDLAAEVGLVSAPPPSTGAAPKPKRPEEPPPPGVSIPDHCGEPCEFKPAFTNPRTQKQVSAKFQCRSADCPAKAETGWPWSIFLDKWVKEGS